MANAVATESSVYVSHEGVLVGEEAAVLIVENPAISAIKGCVMLEYTDDGVNALINLGTKFEWRDVEKCIPTGSNRSYADLAAV
jgi:hypothetical protein